MTVLGRATTCAVAFLAALHLAPLRALPGVEAGGCYTDSHGSEICFPLGDASFADVVEELRLGDPPPQEEIDRRAENLLGPPDYRGESDGGSLTLGCGGSVTVRFTDNAIVDLPGADLYLFEVGPSEEPTRLEISNDGREWIYVGRVWGGRAEVDISWATRVGDSFRYARLTDLRYDCRSQRWPGADVDAIGAIGSARRLTLDASVLFDVDSDVLRPEAAGEVEQVAADIVAADAVRVVVEGHTDSDASEAHNLDLSRRRAQAVLDALGEIPGLGEGLEVEVVGYGEGRPIAPNDSPENKQRNRRVELVVVPGAAAVGEAHGDEATLAATRPGVHGQWSYDGATITIPPAKGGEMQATYTRDGGRIFGQVDGHVIEGHWVERGSKVACETERDGSLHWGRLRMEFDEDFVRYRAQWSYCEEERWRGEYGGRWLG